MCIARHFSTMRLTFLFCFYNPVFLHNSIKVNMIAYNLITPFCLSILGFGIFSIFACKISNITYSFQRIKAKDRQQKDDYILQSTVIWTCILKYHLHSSTHNIQQPRIALTNGPNLGMLSDKWLTMNSWNVQTNWGIYSTDENLRMRLDLQLVNRWL